MKFNLIPELQKLNHDWIILAAFLTIGVILLETFFELKKRAKKQSGLSPSADYLSYENLISEELNLAGKPDAIIEEHGFKIPVEFKPSSDKVKNRYVVQMSVYLRLIEKIYGKKPPYGYLILGKDKRRVQLKNVEEKQDKLDKLLNEMKQITSGTHKAIATPSLKKCALCPARNYCSFKV